jgi:hypothetical protein
VAAPAGLGLGEGWRSARRSERRANSRGARLSRLAVVGPRWRAPTLSLCRPLYDTRSRRRRARRGPHRGRPHAARVPARGGRPPRRGGRACRRLFGGRPGESPYRPGSGSHSDTNPARLRGIGAGGRPRPEEDSTDRVRGRRSSVAGRPRSDPSPSPRGGATRAGPASSPGARAARVGPASSEPLHGPGAGRAGGPAPPESGRRRPGRRRAVRADAFDLSGR